MEIFKIFEKSPIIPVLVVRNVEDAISIVKALELAGIRVIKVALRTQIALEAIQRLAKEFPKIVLGAGTVLTSRQMINAKKAGAHFVVSPGLTRALSDTSRNIDIPYLPGVITPSEVMVAQEMGYKYLKFFPSEYLGGIETLKVYKQVFPDLVFFPTGGINHSNFKDYLALENVFCVGGSWLVTPSEIKEKNWDFIKMAAEKSLETIKNSTTFF